MNVRLRLSIAILFSLLLHVALSLLVMQWAKPHSPKEYEPLQVYLLQRSGAYTGQSPQQSFEPSSAAIKIAEALRVQKTADAVSSTQDNSAARFSSGYFLQQPPPKYPQNEIETAMQLAQFARQQEAQVTAVMAGLSSLSAQLQHVITTSIICKQHADGEIDCMPEPEEKARPILEQFFGLAMQARRLGSVGNLVSLDFGAGQGVSVSLLP
jgi:hypothetical protein